MPAPAVASARRAYHLLVPRPLRPLSPRPSPLRPSRRLRPSSPHRHHLRRLYCPLLVLPRLQFRPAQLQPAQLQPAQLQPAQSQPAQLQPAPSCSQSRCSQPSFFGRTGRSPHRQMRKPRRGTPMFWPKMMGPSRLGRISSQNTRRATITIWQSNRSPICRRSAKSGAASATAGSRTLACAAPYSCACATPCSRKIATANAADNPTDLPGFYQRGQRRAINGDYDLAVQDFTEVIRRDPKHAGALNDRCWVRALINDLKDALQDCNAALQIAPNYPDALDSRGLVNLKLGIFNKAIIDYDAALGSIQSMPLRFTAVGSQTAQLATRLAAKAISTRQKPSSRTLSTSLPAMASNEDAGCGRPCRTRAVLIARGGRRRVDAEPVTTIE